MDKTDYLMIRLRRTAGKGRGRGRGTTVSARRAMALLAGAIVLVAMGCGPHDTTLISQLNSPQFHDTTLTCGHDLALKSGNGQEALAGTLLPNEIVIRATVTPGKAQCSAGFAIGETITWSLASGAGALSATSSTTDAAGEAKVTWTLGPQLGEQLVTVKWIKSEPAGPTIVTTAAFSGIGLSAPYHVIRKVAGDAQTAPLATKLAVQPEIQLLTVRDAGPALPKRESPMERILIEWSVLTGGGSVGSQFVQSIFNGHASVDWTLGTTVGAQSMRARTDISGIPSDPRDSLAVTFTATSTLEPVRSIVLSPAGDPTLGPGETLTLTARTFAGTPLAEVFGRTVTWQSTQDFIATVAPGSGPSPSTVVLRGVAVGGSDISATSEGIKALTRVTVGASARRQRIAYGWARTSMPGLPVQSSFNSTGGSLTVTSLIPGAYQLTIGSQAARQGETETLLITGVENYCKLGGGWTSGPTDLTADVLCFDSGGNRTNSEFTFMLLGDRVLEGHFGFTFADQPSATNSYTPTKSFNSGASNPPPVSVRRVSQGSYLVTFPQNGVNPHALHVTTVGNDASRCNIASVQGDAVRVQCFATSYDYYDINSVAVDSKFTLTLLDRGRPGAPVAYAWAVNDVEDEFEGPGTFTISATHAYNSGGGSVRITRVFEGRYDVTFPGLVPAGATAPAVHVVNRDVDQAKWCSFVDRRIVNGDLTVSVDCHSQDGDREDEAFYLIVIFP